MSFLVELTSMLTRAGMVVPEDFIVYDSDDDTINLRVNKLIQYLNRMGMSLDRSDIQVNPEQDSIEFQADSQAYGGQFSKKAWNKMEKEFEENDFVDFFDYNIQSNKYRIDFNKKIELY